MTTLTAADNAEMNMERVLQVIRNQHYLRPICSDEPILEKFVTDHCQHSRMQSDRMSYQEVKKALETLKSERYIYTKTITSRDNPDKKVSIIVLNRKGFSPDNEEMLLLTGIVREIGINTGQVVGVTEGDTYVRLDNGAVFPTSDFEEQLQVGYEVEYEYFVPLEKAVKVKGSNKRSETDTE